MKRGSILYFIFRGEQYRVNSQGHINANGIGYFSPDWVFLGGSKHHRSNQVTVSLERAFEHPEQLVGCLGWDRDHGTVRQWRGMYNGKLPRITSAWVKQEAINND